MSAVVGSSTGAIGRQLRGRLGVRVPRWDPADPDSRPVVARAPFLVIAALLFALNVLVFAFGIAYGLLALPIALLLSVPAIVAWYRPLIGWLLCLIPLAGLPPLGHSVTSQFDLYPWFANQLVAHLPVLYLVALSTSRVVCAALTVLTLGLGAAAVPYGFAENPRTILLGAITWALATILAVVLGRARLQRRDATLRLAAEQSRRLLLEERTRIARELHDIVAHHMSVIAVRAGTAPYRLELERVDPDPSAEVTAEFRSIGAAARESLGELRQVLGVLRGADAGAGLTPQPGLSDLPKLIESTRLTGMTVRSTLPGSATVVAPATGHAAYRIVQESLSNVVRHAPGAPTTVRVLPDERTASLLIEVINAATDHAHRPSDGVPTSSGHGLTGIGERVDALGGTVRTGPTDDGGFRVRATLPMATVEDDRHEQSAGHDQYDDQHVDEGGSDDHGTRRR